MRIAIGLGLLSAIACVDRNPTASSRDRQSHLTSVAVGQEFQLAIGDSAVLTGTDLTLTFRAVVNDSRCPTTVQCIMAGDALIEFDVDRAGTEMLLRLSSSMTYWIDDSTRWSQTAAIPGFVVGLTALTPSPETPGVEIPPAEYRATILVSALPPLTGTPLPIRRIAGYLGGAGFDTATTLVVRDLASWSDVWRRLNSPTNDIPSLPVVDFTREMIVFVAGTSTADHVVLVTAATWDSDVVRVQTFEQSDGADCPTVEGAYEPVDYVRLPLLNQPVEFTVTKQVHDCGG